MNNFQMCITDMESTTQDRPYIVENTWRPFILPTIQHHTILIIVYTEGNLRVEIARVVSPLSIS